MVVEDKVYITGRGWIICTRYDGKTLHINDKITINNILFEVIGIEAMRYNINSPIGLILRPNNLVKDIEIGLNIN